jgi:hypothetical protein
MAGRAGGSDRPVADPLSLRYGDRRCRSAGTATCELPLGGLAQACFTSRCRDPTPTRQPAENQKRGRPLIFQGQKPQAGRSLRHQPVPPVRHSDPDRRRIEAGVTAAGGPESFALVSASSVRSVSSSP